MRSDEFLLGDANALGRSLLKGMGYSNDEIKKPKIGIANSWNEIVPGHYNLRELADKVSAGVYAAGGTPNPCVVCNRQVKFGKMLEDALAAGFDAVATGHYVRSEWDEARGRWLLKKGVDPTRDQSYVLYMLTQHQLAHSVFPLGGYHKTDLRRMAEERGLVTAHRSDSQDICFVPDGDYAAFLKNQMHLPFTPGNFVEEDGTVVGTHRGIAAYTIGQRKGLGIAFGEPRFVVAKDAAANTKSFLLPAAAPLGVTARRVSVRCSLSVMVRAIPVSTAHSNRRRSSAEREKKASQPLTARGATPCSSKSE